jgi:hypothetical protein
MAAGSAAWCVAPLAFAQSVIQPAEPAPTSTTTISSATTTTAAGPQIATPVSTTEHLTPYVPREAYEAKTGIQFGARVGYAAQAGSIYSGLGVWDASSGNVPIIVDVGWRALPQLYVGAYGQYAPVLLKTNAQSCPSDFNCDAQNWRFGLQVDIHPAPHTRLDPYFGVGSGYEILHTNVNGTVPIQLATGPATALVDQSVTDRGWEFANVTAGFDYRANAAVGVGPFITATYGRFNVHEIDRSLTVSGTPIPSPIGAVDHVDHMQFQVGVRGTFNPGP